MPLIRPAEKRRVQMLDDLRGACILLMIVQHTLYLMQQFHFFQDNAFAEFCAYFLQTPLYQALWLMVVSVFFLIAGIVSHYSHSNLKRCIPVLVVAAGVTAVTYLMLPEEFIKFGVLHCMGACMLLYGLAERFCRALLRVPFWAWLVLFVLYLTATHMFSTYPQTNNMVFRALLVLVGFPPAGFLSADYFPLFPWVFLFFAGAGLGRFVKAGKFPGWFYTAKCPPLACVGRHPLVIYAAHQPVVYLLLSVLSRVFA